MQLREFVLSCRERLSTIYPPAEANAMTGVLCTEYLGVESYSYMVNPGLELKEKPLLKAEAAIERLLKAEPLQYVLGYASFYDQRFTVTPAVLIPRPETEWICRNVIEYALMVYRKRSVYGEAAKAVRILDLCTGSGCIAWTLAKNVPGSEVVGIDISKDALEVACRQNIPMEKGRAPQFFQAGIFDDEAMALALKDQAPFDIIVSNPPYVLESERSLIRRNVLDFEPELALFVSDAQAMKFNKKIAEISLTRLNTDGTGFVEINEALGPDTERVFRDAAFKRTEIIKDLNGKNRFIKFSK